MKHILMALAVSCACSSFAAADGQKAAAMFNSAVPVKAAVQPGLRSESEYTDMSNMFRRGSAVSAEQLAGNSVKVFKSISLGDNAPGRFSYETVVLARVCKAKCTEAERTVRVVMGEAGLDRKAALELLNKKNYGVDALLSFTDKGYAGAEKGVYEIEIRRMENGALVYRYMVEHSASSMDGGPIIYGLMKDEVR